MILIKENRLKVGAFGKNTEEILILVVGMNTVKVKNSNNDTENVLRFEFLPVNYEKIKAGIKEGDNIKILERIKEVYIPDNYEINTVSGLKLLSKKITSELNLVENEDFTIIADANWHHEDMPARVTMPANVITENAGLRGLIEQIEELIKLGYAFKYKTPELYIFYFRTILDDGMAILTQEEIKESVLIEQK